MTPSSLVIVVPVLGRPDHAARVLESIEAATPEPHRVLFVATQDDRAEIRELERLGVSFLVTPWREVGDYARKINLGYRESTEDLIFTGADDLDFRPGWFAAAKAKLRPGIGVVGTNDLGNPSVKRGVASTHSLVTRAYADRGASPGETHMIYHEGYAHQWVDDELVGVARARGAFAFARDSHVVHLHPHWGKGEHDGTYAIGDRALEPSRAVFLKRRKMWVGKRLPR